MSRFLAAKKSVPILEAGASQPDIPDYEYCCTPNDPGSLDYYFLLFHLLKIKAISIIIPGCENPNLTNAGTSCIGISLIDM